MKQNINFYLKNQEDVEAKHFNKGKAFVEYSNDMDNVYKKVEEYNPHKKRKILIVFDDMIWLLICLIIKSLIQ